MFASLLATLLLSGLPVPSPADAAKRTFGPAKTSTPRLLKFKLDGIDPLAVRSARLFTTGGSKRIARSVICNAIGAKFLRVRRTRRQARSDRSRAARRHGWPKLVITRKGAGANSLTPITGRTYYVSDGGSDAGSGRSPSAAWRTVRRVNAASLHPGDGVLFEGGRTFSDQPLSPSRSGIARSRIVYGSYGSGKASLPKGIYLLDVRGLAFQNLSISGAAQGVAASQSGRGAPDMTLENLSIRNAGIAINSANWGDTNWTIRNNTISQTGDSGMILYGTHFAVTGNTISDTGTDGSIGYPKHAIYLKVIGARVSYNRIMSPGSSGISVRYRNSVIEHNEISGGEDGIGWYQYDPFAGKSYWRHNTISDTTGAGIYVSPRDVAGPTRESFVITDNTLSKRSGAYIDARHTTGSSKVSANDEK